MRIAVAAYPLDRLDNDATYIEKITGWVENAVDQGATHLVFPEYGAMELAGAAGHDLDAAAAAVSDRMDLLIDTHSTLAQRHGATIVAASGPIQVEDRYRNRAHVFFPSGQHYPVDKLKMTRFEREQWCITPGDTLTLFDTPQARFGILICYDAEFPLLARALIEAGADVLIVPSCTDALAGYWRVRIGAMARALEGQCYVAQSVTVGSAEWCHAVDENHGAAGVFAPPDRGFPQTGILSLGQTDTPGWVFADLPQETLQDVRHQGQVLNRRDWEAAHTKLQLNVERQLLP